MPYFGRSRFRRSGYGSRRYQPRQTGTIFAGGASVAVRQHSFTLQSDLNQSRIVHFPLLAYSQAAGLNTSLTDPGAEPGARAFTTPQVEQGSRVNSINIDLLITPKTPSDTAVIELYSGRMMTSFVELTSKEVPCIRERTDSNHEYEPWFTKTFDGSNENFVPSGGSASRLAGNPNTSLEIPYTKQAYNFSQASKHWLRGMSKNILAAGVPIRYNRWERVPAKCRRSNRGMYYGLYFLNDSAAELLIECKVRFSELPSPE